MSVAQFGVAYAGTTGIINGTVTDATTHAPVKGIVVTASSPSQSAKATTDDKGFFAIAGLQPDTYAIAIAGAGYSSTTLNGITVQADQTETVTPSVSKTLANIGRTGARSTAGAFQPAQTQNTYSVSSGQIATLQGNPSNISETNLLTSLPGAQLDNRGYPILRGGRENEEGFQFEGISYVDPITNQFVNSLAIHGAQSFQLIPGAGPASQGNSGTGTINVVAKRGARPNFSSFDFELGEGIQHRQFRGEYGWATPNGRISNYTSFVGNEDSGQFGLHGRTAAESGQYFNVGDNTGRDLINNFVYKFGKDNAQSLQLLYQNQSVGFNFNYGGLKGFNYISCDAFGLSQIDNLGIGVASIESIIGFFPSQGGQCAPSRPFYQVQPNETVKLEYNNAINSSTFLAARYYKVNADSLFDIVGVNNQIFFNNPNSDYLTQGGLRTGYAVDFTKQAGSKHLIQAGARYEYVYPIDNSISYDYGFQILEGAGTTSFKALDFLPASDPNSSGYLAGFFPGGIPRIPPYYRLQGGARGDLGYYLSDTFTPNARFKVEAGARIDQADYHFYPTTPVLNGVTNTVALIDSKYKRPSVFEPRVAATLRLGTKDSVRASYGFSANFAPLGFNQRVQNRAVFDAFIGVPAAADPFTGASPNVCGANYIQPCANYADQLFYIYQKRIGTPFQPTLPETFANWDASYSHSFTPDVSVRVTPFYRRGYDGVIRTNSVVGKNPTTGRPITGPLVSTNGGRSEATGLEFYLVKENRAPSGFSGSLAMTYLNEFTNVIPGTASEDFFPVVTAASLAAGNQYRVGFASPFTAVAAIEYRSKGGLRIVPSITYNRGYPIGTGLLSAIFLNGQAVNVPLTDYVGSNLNGVAYSQFVDPQNPGSLLTPNIAATSGTGERSSAGGLLTKANFNTNLTVEFSPHNSKRTTFGMQVFNLFNQLYSGAFINGAVQTVATGRTGPQSGFLCLACQPPYPGAYGIIDTPLDAFRGGFFNNNPNNAPRTANFYVRVNI